MADAGSRQQRNSGEVIEFQGRTSLAALEFDRGGRCPALRTASRLKAAPRDRLDVDMLLVAVTRRPVPKTVASTAFPPVPDSA